VFLPRYMLEQEELLSDIVKREIKSYKRALVPKVRLIVRVCKWLYVGAVIPFISILILVLLAKLGFPASDGAQGQGLAASIQSIGAIVGALTGVLIAILAIAAQVNSQYVGGPESLFKVLISRIGYIQVVCLAGGTIAGALVGCMFDGSEPYWALFTSVLILVPFPVSEFRVFHIP
jgi:hypothetical protein